MEKTVRERANAPHDHGTNGRVCEHVGDQANAGAADHKSIRVKSIIKIRVLRVPGAPMGEIKIPRQDGPFAALTSIAVDIPVFTVHIDVPDHRVGCEQIDTSRNIDVVIEIIDQSLPPKIETINERLKIGVVLKPPSLLLHSFSRIVAGIFVETIRVNLVESTGPVQAGPF